MLKKILILIMGLILVSGLTAGEKIRFGMIGTFSMPFYTGSGYSSFMDNQIGSFEKVQNNPILGFSLGPTVEYSFHSRLSLQTELLLSAAGGGYVLVSGDEREAHLINKFNLDIPVMLKYRIPLKKDRWVYFMAGPQLSILLAESEIVQDGHEYNKHTNSRDMYNPVGLGVMTALGWQGEMKKVDVLLELRYSRDFTRSIRDIGSNYQNVVSIGTGLKFGTAGENR